MSELETLKAENERLRGILDQIGWDDNSAIFLSMRLKPWEWAWIQQAMTYHELPLEQLVSAWAEQECYDNEGDDYKGPPGSIPCETCDGTGAVIVDNTWTLDHGSKWERKCTEQVQDECPKCNGERVAT